MLELQVWHIIVGGLTVILGPPGAMAAIIRVKLNGHLEKITETNDNVKDIQTHMYDMDKRVTILETKEEVAKSP